jgi:hypothetical protein
MITKIVENSEDDIISTTKLQKRIEAGVNYAVFGICKYERIYKLTRDITTNNYYWLNLDSIDKTFIVKN